MYNSLTVAYTIMFIELHRMKKWLEINHPKRLHVSLEDGSSPMHTKVGPALHAHCGESSVRYTHPVSWKNPEMLPFVRSICSGEEINSDSCICLNCRDSINNGMKSPDAFKPRWKKKEREECYMHGCSEKVYIQTHQNCMQR